MSSRVTIVMYHYVRDLLRTRFPRIKGLDLAAFREQLEFFGRHYHVISGADLVGAVRAGEPLPPKSLLLTFDDGYAEHFTHVFPLLSERKWGGCFFPVAATVTEHRLLDVNKIHFIIASTPEPEALIEHVMAAVRANRAQLGLEDEKVYWERCSRDSRYDTPEVTFLKRMLQRELPEAFRAVLIDELFRKFVTQDEAAFAAELYLSPDQLRCMVRHGMTVGSHGHGHYWMNTLPPPEQAREIDASLAFLASLGVPARDWVMCYPYGGYNDSLIDLVRQRGCAVGLAVTVGIADLATDNPLTLPRLDTNDLPKAGDAQPGDWTLRA